LRERNGGDSLAHLMRNEEKLYGFNDDNDYDYYYYYYYCDDDDDDDNNAKCLVYCYC